MHTELSGWEFWVLSALIVGFDIFLTTLILVGVRKALGASGQDPAKVRQTVLVLGLILFGWFGIALWLTWRGVFGSALGQPVPYVPFAIGIPIVVGTFLLRGSEAVGTLVKAVPQQWLVGVQVSRVIGGIFVILLAAGQLPAVFALPAGYGDLIVGVTALIVAARCRRAREDHFVRLWNWFGLADLIVAAATGFLSSPSRTQLFSLDAPNLLIGSFPLGMIPVYAVPLFVVLHFASLMKLHQDHRAASPKMATI